MAFEEKRLAF